MTPFKEGDIASEEQEAGLKRYSRHLWTENLGYMSPQEVVYNKNRHEEVYNRDKQLIALKLWHKDKDGRIVYRSGSKPEKKESEKLDKMMDDSIKRAKEIMDNYQIEFIESLCSDVVKGRDLEEQWSREDAEILLLALEREDFKEADEKATEWI